MSNDIRTELTIGRCFQRRRLVDLLEVYITLLWLFQQTMHRRAFIASSLPAGLAGCLSSTPLVSREQVDEQVTTAEVDEEKRFRIRHDDRREDDFFVRIEVIDGSSVNVKILDNSELYSYRKDEEYYPLYERESVTEAEYSGEYDDVDVPHWSGTHTNVLVEPAGIDPRRSEVRFEAELYADLAAWD